MRQLLLYAASADSRRSLRDLGAPLSTGCDAVTLFLRVFLVRGESDGLSGMPASGWNSFFILLDFARL